MQLDPKSKPELVGYTHFDHLCATSTCVHHLVLTGVSAEPTVTFKPPAAGMAVLSGFITENVELMSFLMNCSDFRNLQKMSVEICRIYGESQQNSMSP